MLYVIGLPLLAIFLCGRAESAPSRSRKLGIFACASGVAAFAPTIYAANYMNGARGDSWFAAVGLVGAGLGLIGAFLAVWALLLRRRDRGVGAGIPIFALLCGLAAIYLGVAGFAMATRLVIPSDEKPWTWHCDPYNFDVTIPSERWNVKPNQNVLGQFASSRPTIAALVAEARPAESDEDFAKVLAKGKEMRNDPPSTKIFEERGKNPHGNEYWIYICDMKDKQNDDYFFGFSITRLRGIGVIMAVEGPYNMKSQAGHAQEIEAMRSQAKTFLSSVR